MEYMKYCYKANIAFLFVGGTGVDFCKALYWVLINY